MDTASRDVIRNIILSDNLLAKENSLNGLNDDIFDEPAHNAKRTVYFGTGLVAKGGVTAGLPLDFMSYLITAERYRKAFNLGGIVHLIADTHAKAVTPVADHGLVDDAAHGIRNSVSNLTKRLGIDKHYKIILASEITTTPIYTSIYKETEQLTDNAPPSAIEYLRLQLTDMEYSRRILGAALKISWVVDDRTKLSEKGRDERFFDSEYEKLFGNGLARIYTLPGRTFDGNFPRVPPYYVADPNSRAMIWPEEDLVQKLQKLNAVDTKAARTAISYYFDIVREYANLFDRNAGDTLGEQINAMLNHSITPVAGPLAKPGEPAPA